MKHFLRFFAFTIYFCFSLASHRAAARPPNIVIILADDMGYGDLGCYGNPVINTPNLDRMAAQGLRFTDFYAGSCLCTPSRAALMTGRFPIRSGMGGDDKHHVLYPNNHGGIPASEILIPQALKKKGYVTGAIGKWHLGDLPDWLPTRHGFDSFFGLPYSNDSDWINAKVRKTDPLSQNPDWHHFNVPLMRDMQIIERPVDQTTLTKRYTEEAIRFIKANRRKPFFLYFAHTFPHVPLFASPAFKNKSPRGRFGDAVQELDHSVGQVLECLRKEGLEKNTFVFFSSDNGPWLTKKWNGGSASLLKDGKGGTWEGGYRVPGIARWPGKIRPGVTHELGSLMDLYNTSLTLAGAPIPNDRPIDGVDMSPILFQNKKSNRDTIYYYYTTNLYAIRKGKYKAHFITHDGYSKQPAVVHDPPLLFDLEEDPGEHFDLAAEHPDIVAEMKKLEDYQNARITAGPRQY
ncbi:MAG TPA: sulfatase [Verrucomicrobiae bacterium]|nr:sulfatase [Verrucomicrobiae bacterium]